MKFKFKAKIYKVGINPCVDVPPRITSGMKPEKGFIPVTGKINKHEFLQTLMPVKNAPYRLYVNGPMMKGASVAVGDTASFAIEQNFDRKSREVAMPKEFSKRLKAERLEEEFRKLTPSRQKEIFRYLGSLKSKEAFNRNVDKIIGALKKEAKAPLFRLG